MARKEREITERSMDPAAQAILIRADALGIGTAFTRFEQMAPCNIGNQWIRSSGQFDAVIDFDAATRDPARPTRLHPEFDSGDHIHPNDAGNRAMAEAVDLSLFR